MPDYGAMERKLYGENQPISYIDRVNNLVALQGGNIGSSLRMSPTALAVQPQTVRRRLSSHGHEEHGHSHAHGSFKGGTGNIVNVRGIRVDASIASKVDAMLADAARAGLHLTGGGYRDPATQRRLYNAWRSGRYRVPSVARPGTSRHEHGLAIDFSNLSNAGFNWLRQNAARYGFYNLPSERWHWSVDGR
jgi:LAS superfamily LD-carboxypeptidase LdcB